MMQKLAPLFFTLFISFNAHSIEVADVTFNEKATIDGHQSTLSLNGAGIRYKIFFKIYAAALYVESPSSDASVVIDQSGAKRLVLHIIYSSIDKEKMVNSAIEGFEENLSSDEYKALESRINQFVGQYEEVKEGDVLSFDYTPAKGTQFIVNGELKTTVEGADFNQALLKIWIGEEPATDSLKRDLLNNN